MFIKHSLNVIFGIAFLFSGLVFASQDKRLFCTSAETWVASITQATLQNESDATRKKFHKEVDHKKTRVSLIASEQTGTWLELDDYSREKKPDDELYRQVHLIEWFLKDGSPFMRVVAVNDASRAECSMYGPEIYVIDRKIKGCDYPSCTGETGSCNNEETNRQCTDFTPYFERPEYKVTH